MPGIIRGYPSTCPTLTNKEVPTKLPTIILDELAVPAGLDGLCAPGRPLFSPCLPRRSLTPPSPGSLVSHFPSRPPLRRPLPNPKVKIGTSRTMAHTNPQRAAGATQTAGATSSAAGSWRTTERCRRDTDMGRWSRHGSGHCPTRREQRRTSKSARARAYRRPSSSSTRRGASATSPSPRARGARRRPPRPITVRASPASSR